METSERAMDGEANANEEHVLTLRAVLHDLVRRKGRAEVARELGLDPRTVDACVDGEGMSWRVREALERTIGGDEAASAAVQRKRVGALERRVEALEKQLASHLNDAEGDSGASDEKQDQGNRQAERTPDAQEAAKAPAPPPNEAQGPEYTVLGRRLYPQLLYREPWPDDEQVYGEAWSLIEEWRELWNSHSNNGKGMKWLRTEERIRALEVAMLEQHGLTLPPEKQPLYGLDRRDQLIWRKETLREVRRAVAWRHLLMKVVTCGLWRSRWWPGRA